MRPDNKIHVVTAFLKGEQKVNNLTKLQKWICKLFNITPSCQYHQVFELLLVLPYKDYGGAVGDTIVFADMADTWFVEEVHSRRIRVATSGTREIPRTERDFRGLEGMVVGRTFREASIR